MIILKNIKYKNFLSSGGQFIEIQLDKSPTTLIMGANGAGKSTLLDALCFVLFGKAFRNINKPQLLSSINQKDCVVEVVFSIGKRNYRVVRGIKPAIFNIFCDNQLLAQDAATKDYQSYLENTILNMNYRSFTQIVILGTASFTPFMELAAASRREIIEDILDIKIFSEMNLLLKERMSNLRDNLNSIEANIFSVKEHVALQQNFIKTLDEGHQKRKGGIERSIQEKEEDLALHEKALVVLEQERETLEASLNKNNIEGKLKSFEVIYDKLQTKIEKINRDIAFYTENNSCPTCFQTLPEDFKEEAIEVRAEKKDELLTASEKAKEQLNIFKEIVQDNQVVNRKMIEVSQKIKEERAVELLLRKQILEMFNELNSPGDHDIEAEREKLKLIASRGLELTNVKSKLGEEKQYLDICGILLKDTGIKTAVIKQYLPVINKLINKYLSIMDFFVHFELNEAFSETIKSRYRDEFTYASFSEGEKQRINLALLFTWRQVAKLKNSVSTNLLILDEIFDSSLDSNGTDYVMQLLDALAEDSNIFVISHKTDTLADKFASCIRFEKKNNFSVVATAS